MMLTQMAREIDRLNQELAEQKDKTMDAWVKMLDMVPMKLLYQVLIWGHINKTEQEININFFIHQS